jgi:hypothetical protein
LLLTLQHGTPRRKLILTKKDKNDQSEKFSEEIAQRQTVQRQGGNTNKVQMESLVPDLSKIIKAKRVKEVLLRHVWLSDIKALSGTSDRRQTHIFWPGSSTHLETN